LTCGQDYKLCRVCPSTWCTPCNPARPALAPEPHLPGTVRHRLPPPLASQAVRIERVMTGIALACTKNLEHCHAQRYRKTRHGRAGGQPAPWCGAPPSLGPGIAPNRRAGSPEPAISKARTRSPSATGPDAGHSADGLRRSGALSPFARIAPYQSRQHAVDDRQPGRARHAGCAISQPPRAGWQRSAQHRDQVGAPRASLPFRLAAAAETSSASPSCLPAQHHGCGPHTTRQSG
jgi:hypothetical protein